MGICWGSPNFPTPSFGRSFPDGPDLTLSSSVSDTASSALTNSHSNRAASGGAVATPEALNSPPHYKELRVFKYAELKAITGNFSHPLGETHFDGRDVVHCGWLQEGRVVEEIAVKVIEFPRKPSRLKRSIEAAVSCLYYMKAACILGVRSSAASGETWGAGVGVGIVLRKVQLYGGRSHANLVRLLGYCLKGRKLLLVYESLRHYFSLEDHLFKNSSDMVNKRKAALPPLPWHKRLQIAVEAAQGLARLHLMGHTSFRYFHASYVLLDRSYAVKLAPFNFLVTYSSDNAGTTMSKNVAGIEVGNDAGTVYRRKQDVYDFGVILLEILTGLALGGNRWIPEYGSRIEWIKERVLDRDNLVTLMDSNMGSYPLEDAFQVAQIAVRCIGQFPLSRPTMPQIEEKLRQIKAAEISFAVTAERVNSI